MTPSPPKLFSAFVFWISEPPTQHQNGCRLHLDGDAYRQKFCGMSVLIICLLFAGCSAQNNGAAQTINPTTPTTANIRDVDPQTTSKSSISIDYSPLLKSESIFISIGENGRIEKVVYDRNLLAVRKFYRGSLSSEESRKFWAQIRSLDFGKSLPTGNPMTGPEEGDVYELWLEPEGKHASGTLNSDGSPINSFVTQVLLVKPQSKPEPLAYRYVRSKRIEKSRFDRLRQSSVLRFISVEELPSSLQLIVAPPISTPLHFHALSKEQYEQLRTLSSHGGEVFVVSRGTGHQLTLYNSQSTQTKED